MSLRSIKKTMQRIFEMKQGKGQVQGHSSLASTIGQCLVMVPAGVLASSLAFASPQGGTVVGGTGTIQQPSATQTLVNQQSQKMAIDWQTFNLAAGDKVRFVQPSASASVLNRIFDQNPSQIFGSIEANGRVFLQNPNGLIFGAGATVNVGSFMATTLNANVQDFMADGAFRFGDATTSAGGAIINRGLIQAATGGSVTLVGGSVSNEGLILATKGSVNLASGRTAVLDFDGDGLLSFAVSGDVLENAAGATSAVANSGTITADGGQVLLTGKAAKDVFANVVNNTGIIQANSIDTSNGTIRLVGGDTGIVANSGTLRAKGDDAGEKGGTVQMLGEKVGLFDSGTIDVSGDAGGGTALVGGDFQGKNAAIRNASMTYVGTDASIDASAISNGDGGKVIVWADDTTRFYGSIAARGGVQVGNGGFVEVSGKQNLDFNGTVDTRAPMGKTGTLLLDPTNLTISDTASGTGSLDTQFNTTTPGIIAFGNGGATESVSAGALEALSAATNIDLQATNSITIAPLTTAGKGGVNAELTLDQNGSVKFRTGAGGFSMDATNKINVTGAGTLLIDAIAASSGGTGDGAIATGTLQTNGGAITLNGTTMSLGAINSGGGLLAINNLLGATQSGIFAGSGGLTKQGAGTLTLSQANTYTGATTINAGTLSVATIGNGGVAGNLGQASNAAANLVLGGGTLQYTGGNASTDRNFTLTGGTTSFIDVTTNNLTMSGASTSTSGALTKTGSGTLTLSGTNLYTGATTINAGTLSVATIGDGGVAGNLGQASNVAANLVLGGGTLQYTGGNASTDRNFTLTGGTTSFIDVTTNNLTMSGASTSTSGALTKIGSGTLTLSGTNLYTGATTILGGKLLLGTDNVLHDNTAVTINGNTSVLDVANNTETILSLTQLNGGQLKRANHLTISGVYSLEGGLDFDSVLVVDTPIAFAGTMDETGFVRLGGADPSLTTLFATTLNIGGTLILGAANQITSGTSVVVDGGTLSMGTYSDLVNALTLKNNGSITGTSGVLTIVSSPFDLQSGTVSAILGGSAGVTKTTSSTVTLSGGNTYSGATTISEGTLTANSTAALGDGSGTNTLIFNGGTLRAGGDITSPTTRGVTMTGAGTIDTQGYAVSLGGVITGSGGLTTQGSGFGTLTLSGDNSFWTGAIEVTSGTLIVNNPTALGDNTSGTTVSGGKLTIDSVAVNEDIAISAGGTLALKDNAAVATRPVVFASGSTLDYSAYGGSVNFNLTTPLATHIISSTLGNIGTVIGSGVAGSTLTGATVATGNWVLDGSGGGVYNTTLNFSGFDHLVGNATNDTIGGSGLTYNTFTSTTGTFDAGSLHVASMENINDTGAAHIYISNASTGGGVSGDISTDGGTLDYSGETGAVQFDFANNTGLTTGVGGTWTGLSTVVGNNTVSGITHMNTTAFNLTGANAGSTGAGSSLITYTGFTAADTTTVTGAVGFNDGSKSNQGVTFASATSVSGTGAITNVLGNFDDTTHHSANSTITYSAGFTSVAGNGGDITGTASFALTGADKAGTAASGDTYTGFNSASGATSVTGASDFNHGLKSDNGMTFAAVTNVTGTGAIANLGATAFNLSGSTAGAAGAITYTGFTAADTTAVTGAVGFDDGSKSNQGMTFANATSVSGTGAITNVLGNFDDTTHHSTNSTITYSAGFTSVAGNGGDITGTASFALTGADKAGTAASGDIYTGFNSASGATSVTGASDFNHGLKSDNGMTFAAVTNVTGTGAIANLGATAFNLSGSTAGAAGAITYTGFTAADTTAVTGAADFDDGSKSNQGMTFANATSVSGTGAIANVLGNFAIDTLVSSSSGIDYSVGFTSVAGNGSGTLTGAGQTYNLDNTIVNTGNNGLVSWTGFGTMADSGAGIFKMGTAGSITGNLSAVGGTLNYASYATPVSINQQTAKATGIGGTFSGIATVVGNGAGTTLTGSDAGETFTLTGANAGTAGGLAFTGVNNLKGGTGNDTFNGAGGSLSGSIIDDVGQGGGGTTTLGGVLTVNSIRVDGNSIVFSGDINAGPGDAYFKVATGDLFNLGPPKKTLGATGKLFLITSSPAGKINLNLNAPGSIFIDSMQIITLDGVYNSANIENIQGSAIVNAAFDSILGSELKKEGNVNYYIDPALFNQQISLFSLGTPELKMPEDQLEEVLGKYNSPRWYQIAGMPW